MPQSKAKLIDAPLSALSNVTGSPTDGQALVWDAALQKWKPGSVAAAGGSSATITLLDSIASQFNGTLKTFNLTASGAAYTPQNALAIEVVLGGVQQEPLNTYTVSGSAITFSDAPATGTSCYIIGTSYGSGGSSGSSGSKAAAIAMSLIFG